MRRVRRKATNPCNATSSHTHGALQAVNSADRPSVGRVLDKLVVVLGVVLYIVRVLFAVLGGGCIECVVLGELGYHAG